MFPQISLFLPNKPGEFSKFLDLLIENKIEIRAITVAESDEYGLLLILVDKPMECIELLDQNEIPATVTDVIAVKIDSQKNTFALKNIAELLGKNNVNIEYLYSTLVKDQSLIILRVSDNKMAMELLKNEGYLLEERKSF
ncbi:MAG: hypothetical protein P8Y97_21885 [Candidatus Lokiarchaeota archaeon]